MAKLYALIPMSFLVIGCAVGGSTAGGMPADSGDSRSGARALPVQAYIFSDEQRRVVHRAAARIADACMARQGFSVGLPAMLQPLPGGHKEDFLDRRYAAVYDEQTARRYGLHMPSYVDRPTLPPDDPALTKSALEALFGSWDERHPREEVDVAAGRLTYGGCLGEAEAQLVKGLKYPVGIEGYAAPVRILSLDPTPSEDRRVLAAQAKWSACMAESGYRMKTTLSDLDGIPGVDMSAASPSPAEIQLALTDVKCQQRTKVVDIWFQVESEYQRAKIDEQAEVFAEIKKENQQLLQRAADLLGEAVPAGSGG